MNNKEKLKDLFDSQKYNEVQEFCYRLIKEKNDEDEAYFFLGKIEDAKDENYRQSIEYYNMAIEKNPKHARAYNNRGVNKGKLSDYTGKLLDIATAINIDPTIPFFYANIGNARSCLKYYNDAIDDYNKAIELGFNDSSVYYNRALTYYDMQQYENALKDFEKVYELNPYFSDVTTKIEELKNKLNFQ